MRPICACLLLALALPASAEIYRYTDERGNPVYTNQPPQGVATESVQLGPTNTVASPRAASGPDTAQTDTQAPATYDILEVTGVADGSTLRANAGNFAVVISLQPTLHDDHQLQLLLDGQPLAPPGRQTRFTFDSIDRGEHQLQAVVFHEDKELQRSPAVTFTVQRVHIGSPALPRPQPRPAN